MAATLTPTIVDAAPGNNVVIAGTGLTAGAGATVVLANQGLVTPGPITLPAVFSTTSVTVTIPDGATTGTLTVTASDLSTATITLRIVSQYVQASEYMIAGEGIDIARLAPGELDAVLRKASSYADTFMGGTKRLLQSVEQYRWRESRRVYPRRLPVISVDAFRYLVSNSQSQSFDVTDVIRISDLDYVEILTWAIGNYSLIAAIATLGYDASIVEMTYTAGYTVADYPQGMRDAVTMITTELLTYRSIQYRGFGGFSQIREGISQYQRRGEVFSIPQPAQDLLRPFVSRTLR